MKRRAAIIATTALLVGGMVVALPAAAVAPGPGADGIGDPYFPKSGNGGYDVKQYRLNIDYRPGPDKLFGRARILAKSTQALSRFNLDFDGMTVRKVTVRGKPAEWSRGGGELQITPSRPIKRDKRLTTVIKYDGVPTQLPRFGPGVIPTEDGALVLGEPMGASTWFPVNDHPLDKASYRFQVTVPKRLKAISNGALVRVRAHDGRRTWIWRAAEPMAPYLATTSIGRWRLRDYEADGLRYWDAIDPALFDDTTPAPRSGSQYAWSQQTGDVASYKRLSRTITVPAEGADLSFRVNRQTEDSWDFFFVETHPVGSDDWTTLPDENDHTSQDTGFVCPFWLTLHPFLGHYQTDNGDDTCSPTGTTGEWWAASGESDGYERWEVDLDDYAGQDVEVSLTYTSDDLIQFAGVFVDDIVVSTGEGSTGFEDDGNPLDGWDVPGAPGGSEPNENDWIATTAVDLPEIGHSARGSLDRQPEIIEFLSSRFGPYPFRTAGGVVDDADLGFALETQTRPVYSPFFFASGLGSGDGVVVHEIAHQWYGDHVALARWKGIWLNEGFASYAEWLWSEEDGFDTADEIFDFFYNEIPADDPFWELTIGDPGRSNLFDGAVYARGAMTLHALREAVGDEDFFTILQTWADGDGNRRTPEFIRLAEEVSGEELDQLFEDWLFTGERPEGYGRAGARSDSAAGSPSPLVKRILSGRTVHGPRG